jgi:hypothetical protein
LHVLRLGEKNAKKCLQRLKQLRNKTQNPAKKKITQKAAKHPQNPQTPANPEILVF